jgi:hypothetical protein
MKKKSFLYGHLHILLDYLGKFKKYIKETLEAIEHDKYENIAGSV